MQTGLALHAALLQQTGLALHAASTAVQQTANVFLLIGTHNKNAAQLVLASQSATIAVALYQLEYQKFKAILPPLIAGVTL